MGDQILCTCGHVLVEAISDEGVTPVGGEPIRFRRKTDYVICSNCHKVYDAETLLGGGSLDDSFIEKLERMAEGDEA